MNKFKTWYVTHQDAITWFLIGLLTNAGIEDLARGDLVWAGISFAMAYINFAFRKVRLG